MYLHQNSNFKDLIERTAVEQGIISPYLVEKDYWIMHCLYALSDMDLKLELKGGTSLSKAFGIIHRFSEDLDVKITPNQELLDFQIYTGKNHDKSKHRKSRKRYFDWLCLYINKKIDGIIEVKRDHLFDDSKFRNGGIRLLYDTKFNPIEGIKDGILLELGFEKTTPNVKCDISSWAYDFAQNNSKSTFTDNRANNVSCYKPEYTLIEKIQAILSKYKKFKQNENQEFPANFIRHYYDIYCLLGVKKIQNFIATDEYNSYKKEKIKFEDMNLKNFEGFLLNSEQEKKIFINQYKKSQALYYKGPPPFENILKRIQKFSIKL